MRKLKLIMATLALILGWSNASADTEPTASTPSVGNTYYLYNPTTKLFMTTNVDLPFVRPTGSAWKLEAADGHDGWVTLRLADNDTEGCGYFWGKWWANNPAASSASYSDERVYQLENTSGKNYKLKSYAWGATTAYIYINKGNQSDRSFRLACNSQDQGDLDEGYMTWQFITEEDYATYMSMDYTSYIKNNDFIDGTANWTLDGSGNKQALGNTAIEYWNAKAAEGTFDYHQEITVPAGKYILRAAMYNSTNGETVKIDEVDTPVTFDPAGQCGVYGTSNGTTKNANVTVAGEAYNIYTTDELLVPDGNLRLGFKNTTTMTARWFGTDWIQLTCIGYCLSGVAIALPGGGTMTADQWYYFTAAAGDKRISATTPDDIVITTDGNELTTGGTALNSYAGKLVSGTKYYIKSSSNQTVTFETSVPSLAEGTYFFKVAKAHNGTNEVDAVPAGKYLSRGRSKGTHATLDAYGLPIEVAVLANGYYSLSPADTKRFYYHANSWDCLADKTPIDENSMFELTLSEGKYKIRNVAMASGKYLKYNTATESDATVPVYDDGTGTNNGPYILWTAESLSDHATAMTALKNSQAATAAAAAYASGNYSSLSGITTVSGLETALTSYVQGDFVSASAIESISEKYQGNQPGSDNVVETVYSNTIEITQAGLYKFSMQAFYRAASNETTQALHTAGADFPPVVLFFGSAETQIKSVYDEGGLDQGIAEGYFETETVGGAPVQYNGKYYTNGQHNSVIIFQKDYYHNDVWLYVSEPGTYSYGVKYMGWANANMQWFIYSPESVTITSYAEAATSADYTALSAAISAYDAATWGFEEGEYAPYNNVNAINNIATARAINSEEVNSKLLVTSLTNYLELTANALEVNAFSNDGYFPSNFDAIGWKNSAWVQQEGSYLAVPSGTSITYGETVAYTMPLKADTYYVLTFRHASWDGSNKDNGGTVSVLRSGKGLEATNYDGNTENYKGNDAGYKKERFVFQTDAAGDYVFTLTGRGGGRTTVKDFNLIKAPNQSVTVSSAGYATYVNSDYDLDYTGIEGLTAYKVSVSGSLAILTSVTKVPAGAGVVLKGAGTYSVPVTTDADELDGNALVRGTGAAVPTTADGKNNYVLSTDDDGNNLGFYQANGETVPTNRAYLQTTATGARLTFVFEDETTGISDASRLMDNGEMRNDNFFNLNGQKVSQPTKGLYIKNGKKVVIK